MASGPGGSLYRCGDTALVRAAHHTEQAVYRLLTPSMASVRSALPAWPDLTRDTTTDVERWRGWLREVWAVDAIAEAVELASPTLARQVTVVCAGGNLDVRQVRRMVFSMARYLLRVTGRATPFGLFAGVACASFGPELAVRWGTGHSAVAGADAGWLAEVIAGLESCSELLERLVLVANNLCFVRGERLVVPYPPWSRGEQPSAPFEVSMRNTPAVRITVEAARSPIRADELAGKLVAEFPTAVPSTIAGFVAELVRRRVLLSSLHAPSTVTDPLGHLISQLETAGAADIPQSAELLHRLREIDRSLVWHNSTLDATTRTLRVMRTAVAEQMSALRTTARQPLAVDLRLDCQLILPRQVAREAEAAASALARLSPQPFGPPAWGSYHTRFFERYGIGALVPVADVVDPDVGVGFPAGYLGCEPEPQTVLTVRDQRLLALAQAAAMDGRDEVVLDEGLIASFAVGEQEGMQVPPHLELCFQLHAESSEAVDRGDFDLSVVSASRGAGTTIGRFVGLLEQSDRRRVAKVFAALPGSDSDALPVQLSFAPLSPGDAHVARAPEFLRAVISLGEHRGPSQSVIELDDLAVGCDSRRLYLASVSRRCRLEPMVLHALDLRTHTPPLARFLAEIGKAQAASVTSFDWGAAASLPFLPRLRYHRAILSPARWLLDRADLPGPNAPWLRWQEAFVAWRSRRRLPNLVCLTERDQRLKLNLDEKPHLALLRTHLSSAKQAVLTEAPATGRNGWFGGRAHEIVVPMITTQPATWPRVPPVRTARVIGRGHGHLPGASTWLYTKLYGQVERQTEILAHHLPALLSQWSGRGEQPAWWYIRYRDPGPHLRLRIALPAAHDFGLAANRVSTWADDLRRQGLLRDLQFATSYSETGRWGSGPLMAAAEEVFGADSRALVAQFVQFTELAQPSRPHPQALIAANFVAITVGFSGSTEAGMTWLIKHAKTDTAFTRSSSRSVSVDTIRLADPSGNWAALQALPGGHAIAEAWQVRHRVLTKYRRLLATAATAEGIDPDAVLDAILHAHHIRAVGVDRDDERTCLRLARAVALAWRARRTNHRRCQRTPGGDTR